MTNTSNKSPFYRVSEVADLLSISTATVWNKCNAHSRHYDPHFPKPIKISANTTRWLEHEINDYIIHLAHTRQQGAKS